MKHNLFLNACYLMVIALIVSCSNDDDQTPRVARFDIAIEVLYPEGYNEEVADNANVNLRNTASGEEWSTTTDASGVAGFEALEPGPYQLSVNKTLSEELALSISGVPNQISLNYSESSLQLSTASQDQPIRVRLAGSISGSLLIKQMYYAGSLTPEGTNYFFDQFVEIYNNSGEAIALDGLYISTIYGVSGQINENSAPTPFADDQEHVYASTAWQIPGSGEEYVLAPFESIVIAQQGINHQSEDANPNSPVDLSNADFEMFVEGSSADVDAPNVQNLNMVYHPFNATFALYPVFGASMVIWRTEDFESLSQVPIPDTSPEFPQVLQIPNDLVIDAVDALRDGNAVDFKRIPTSLDAGFTFISSEPANYIYNSKSVIRRYETVEGNIILIDTNNSSDDFTVQDIPIPHGF